MTKNVQTSDVYKHVIYHLNTSGWPKTWKIKKNLEKSGSLYNCQTVEENSRKFEFL